MVDILLEIEKLIGSEKVLTGKSLEDRYDHIWRMEVPLSAKAVLLPKETEEVSAILKICHKHDQPVVIHGGLTGLVGGTESQKNEIVISTEKMNRILELDEKSRTMTVGAGVILENIHMAAAEKDFMFPMSFGAKGSAQIGGIISTNAGGLRVFRYGMTRDLVLGLEAVLADGTIISSMKKIIKDNSGYDLKQLFIGSEGTLGIVTKAVIKLEEKTTSRNSALIGLNSYSNVIELLRLMDGGLGGTLSGFELMWETTYRGLTNEHSSVKPPLAYGYKYYVLLDSLGSNQSTDAALFEKVLEEAFEKGFVEDAVFAKTESELNWFWTIREDVRVIVSQAANDQHFDISLPIGSIGQVVDEIVDKLKQIENVEIVFSFGHVADGNIHFIVGKKNDSIELTEKVNEIVYCPIKAIGGSVSAEHGIGTHKRKYLIHSRSENEIDLMKTLKRALDPKNLLNRNKLIVMQ